MAASTAGRLRWTRRQPGGVPAARRGRVRRLDRSQGRPTSAACARMASISTWVTSSTGAPPAGQGVHGAFGPVGVHPERQERRVAALSASRCPDRPPLTSCGPGGAVTVACREARPSVSAARVGQR